MGLAKNVSGSKLSPFLLLAYKGRAVSHCPCHCLASELMPSCTALSGGKQSWFSLDSRPPESLLGASGSRQSFMSQHKPGTRPGRHRTSCPWLTTDERLLGVLSGQSHRAISPHPVKSRDWMRPLNQREWYLGRQPFRWIHLEPFSSDPWDVHPGDPIPASVLGPS